MKFEKMNDGSFVHNCRIVRRDNDKASVLFHQNGNESVAAFLNGYAIIPLEEYYQLKGEHGEDGNNWPDEMLKNVEEVDKQLYGE